MAVRRDIPQIEMLRIAVEKQFGHTVESRADFTNLGSDIERVTHEHIAENTLRRIWGRIRGYDTVYTRTLDVLCHYIGYVHWDSYYRSIKNAETAESALTVSNDAISVSDLHPGDRIRIGWLPDRICIVEFQGGRVFRAIDCKNSTLQNGDSFECSLMLKHYPLFVDNLVHGGEICQRYSMGLDNGLTILEKL